MAGRVPHCRPRSPDAGQLSPAARVAQGPGLGQRGQPGPLLASGWAPGHDNDIIIDMSLVDLLLLLLSQVTLYVPGLVLRPGNNTMLLMEQVRQISQHQDPTSSCVCLLCLAVHVLRIHSSATLSLYVYRTTLPVSQPRPPAQWSS